jgi:Nucleotidyl transferase AbiEii toxin, Type IV TA system
MAPVAAAAGSARPPGVGAAAHHAGFTVSLEGLPPAHLRVLLDGLPVFERYGLLLAGGYAFRAHEILHRPSQDLDFATRDNTPLPEIAAQVQRAFQRAGYSVRLVEAASPRYARLVLQLPGSGEELEMDLLKEVLGPRWVTVQVTPAASVRAVSLEDTVGLKARAWHDRFVIRDIIDLHSVAGTFSYADLENLARRHDPDLDLEAIQDHLAGVSVFADEDFAEYGLDGPTIANLRTWVTGWYDDLALRLVTDLTDDEVPDDL